MTSAEQLTTAWTPRGAAWTEAPRREALEAFARTGFPTPRHEDWKYTSLAALQRASLDLVAPAAAERVIPDLGLSRIVFVDGRLDVAATRLDRDARVRICGLTQAMEVARERLFRLDDPTDAPTSLNRAWFEDGLFLEVPRGVSLDAPIHVVSISTGAVAHPRDLIVLGDGASARILHQHLGPDDRAYLVNRSAEVWVGRDATLNLTEVVSEGSAAFHLASMRVDQGTGSTFSLRRFALSGGLTRLSLSTDLHEGATADVAGLSLAADQQVHDLHTLISHRAPHGTSRESLRGVIANGGRAVFTGKVHVDPGAQRTSSEQSIRSLLLGDNAIANGRPQLEIHADDVKCSHGLAVGRLDPEAMFFLQSRGLSPADARQLLTWAFATAVVEDVDASVREPVAEWVQAALSKLTGVPR
jgi:Fe-S cluster assembly protein SufD